MYSYNAGAGSSAKEAIAATSFINLQTNGTYSRDFGTFDYGHWQLMDSVLILTNVDKRQAKYIIKRSANKELQMRINANTTIVFEKLRGKFEDEATNPFSIKNNRWRIPTAAKENEQQLKARLANHCRFYEMYFKWALDNKVQTLDVRSTPSPIKIYGNGFELKSFDQLPEQWKTYFYNEEDCVAANDILKNVFKENNIVWGNTDNRYKMFLSAFQQLQGFLGK